MIIIIKVKDTATLARIEDFSKMLGALGTNQMDNKARTDNFNDVIDSITSEKQ